MGERFSKHERYVRALAHELQSRYEKVYLHVEFKTKKRSLGEIDIIAQRGDSIHLFEVKCSYRITKARKQLSRFHRLLRFQSESLFFYHGATGKLEEITPYGEPDRRSQLISRRWTLEGLASQGVISVREEREGFLNTPLEVAVSE